MHRPLKVSVAVITYNGVSLIKEQLISILNQTVKPDEVVISDDGSTDGTIELIKRIIDEYSNSGICITLLIDNPNHGIGPNFSWAVQHTTGDIIFSAGQDDVWKNDKIEKVLKVYDDFPDAKVVLSDLYLIDKDGKSYSGKQNPIYVNDVKVENGKPVRLNREKYLTIVETVVLIPGPVISFRRTLYDLIIPIPPNTYEDQWIEFLGLAENSLFYLKEKTTYYRLHDSFGHSENVSLCRKITRAIGRIKNAYKAPLNPLCYGSAMLYYFCNHNKDDFEGRQSALDIVNTVIHIARTQFNYMKMNRIKGAGCLTNMFISNTRYRKSGLQSFFMCLLYILVFSKKRRNKEINTELMKCGSLIFEKGS